MQEKRDVFDSSEIQAFRPGEKIAILSTINPEGLPHMTLITSIQAQGPARLTFGQFCQGRSKDQIQHTTAVGFLVMTLDRKLWRGKARWTHLKKDGPEFEAYNNLPMFRYNAYFGIHTVHYLDLVEKSGPQRLPMGSILSAWVLTRMVRGTLKTRKQETILTPFARRLINRPDTLTFLSWISSDGFPVIVPLLQCQAPDSQRLVFSSAAYRSELKPIPGNTVVAVFSMTLKMESVLMRGVFTGLTRSRLLEVGGVDIDWVYNSMPPCHGQIYPGIPLTPVVAF